MRVLVSSDIEGVAGVTGARDIFEGRPGQDRAVALMRSEVEAAVAGPRDAGAKERVIRDARGSAMSPTAEGCPRACAGRAAGPTPTATR